MRPALLSLLFVVAACGPPHIKPPPCAAPFIGDPSLPPEAVMLWTDGASRTLADVQPGQVIPLEPPPQGGYVIYLAAHVRNLGGCVDFSGSLRDPISNDEFGMDGHGATLVVHADGFGYPDPSSNSNVSNVNPCPDYSKQDVNGKMFNLVMTVSDKQGRTAKVTQPIVPTCNLANPLVQRDCVCTCTANYFLGRCNFDGGVTD